MNRFLLDANLSPRTAAFLIATFGFDVVDLHRAWAWRTWTTSRSSSAPGAKTGS